MSEIPDIEVLIRMYEEMLPKLDLASLQQIVAIAKDVEHLDKWPAHQRERLLRMFRDAEVAADCRRAWHGARLH